MASILPWTVFMAVSILTFTSSWLASSFTWLEFLWTPALHRQLPFWLSFAPQQPQIFLAMMSCHVSSNPTIQQCNPQSSPISETSCQLFGNWTQGLYWTTNS
jgi:hypothetical protein